MDIEYVVSTFDILSTVKEKSKTEDHGAFVMMHEEDLIAISWNELMFEWWNKDKQMYEPIDIAKARGLDRGAYLADVFLSDMGKQGTNQHMRFLLKRMTVKYSVTGMRVFFQ